MTSLRLWDHFVEPLHQRRYRVLRYDQPGHGSSTAPQDPTETTFTSICDDVKALLDFLRIGKIHAWVGISMGAATGAVFVTRYPGVVSKLVLSDTITCSPINAAVADPFAARVKIAREKDDAIEMLTEATLARWFAEDWRNSHKNETQRVREFMHSTTREGFIACCHALQAVSFNLSPLLSHIGQAVGSVMLMVGEWDADLPQSMAKMRDEIQRNSKVAVGWAVIPKAGHVPVIDGSEHFSQAVLAYLDDLSPGEDQASDSQLRFLLAI